MDNKRKNNVPIEGNLEISIEFLIISLSQDSFSIGPFKVLQIVNGSITV